MMQTSMNNVGNVSEEPVVGSYNPPSYQGADWAVDDEFGHSKKDKYLAYSWKEKSERNFEAMGIQSYREAMRLFALAVLSIHQLLYGGSHDSDGWICQ